MTEHFQFTRKSGLFILDCLAVLVGALIAAPVVLILASPFISGF